MESGSPRCGAARGADALCSALRRTEWIALVGLRSGRRSFKPEIAGSNPAEGSTRQGRVAEWQTRQTQNLVSHDGRAGSSPASASDGFQGSSMGGTTGSDPVGCWFDSSPWNWAILGVWRRHTTVRRSRVRFDS
jgi:hypothetical protein